MSLPRQYSRALQTHLRCRAVWPPTEAVAPGDYGEFVGGVWTRRGNVTADFRVPVVVESGGRRAEKFQFHSEREVGGGLDGAARLGAAEVGLDISLERRASFFVSLAGLEIDRLRSPRDVAVRLGAVPPWRHRRWYVVHEVFSGHDLVFYGAQSGGGGLQIRGSTLDLQRFLDAGRLGATLTFVARGDVGVQLRGSSDVRVNFGVNLFRLRAIGADRLAFSAGGPDDDGPLDALDPADEPEDDDDGAAGGPLTAG